MQLDGRPATHLELHVTADASCPDGPLAMWQSAELTDDFYWVSGPGDRHSVYLVDVADATLMFEVLRTGGVRGADHPDDPGAAGRSTDLALSPDRFDSGPPNR